MPRKALDGAKLAADVTRLLGEDKASPPAAQPSLMDVVRELAPYIETRAKVGWTDPMIAVVLTQAGYPISAETLRSYRKRLRDEGLLAPLPASGREAKTRSQIVATTTPAPPPRTEVPSAAGIMKAPDAIVSNGTSPRAAMVPATEDAAVARAPPASATAPPPARTFRVDRTKLPPDRA